MDLGFGVWHKMVCDWIRMATRDEDDDMDLDEWTPAQKANLQGHMHFPVWSLPVSVR